MSLHNIDFHFWTLSWSSELIKAANYLIDQYDTDKYC